MKKTANGIYHNNLESVKNTLKYTRLAITKTQQSASFTDGEIYLITFTDSEYIQKKRGFESAKIIIAYDCSRFAGLLAYWTLNCSGQPIYRLDLMDNTATIYNANEGVLVPISLGACDPDNINLNLNNFNGNLRMDVYNNINIMRIINI